MSVIQVGLVDTTGALDSALLDATAAALNIQVMRDLPQFWNVQVTVRFLPNPKSLDGERSLINRRSTDSFVEKTIECAERDEAV